MSDLDDEAAAIGKCVMIADPSSSLGLFAVVWLALCVLSSVLVTSALLRRDAAVEASRPNRATRKPNTSLF